MDWFKLLQRGYHLEDYHRNMLELFDLGWNADYNDPNNYVVPLMSKQSDDNWAQIDDVSLQNWMDQAQRESEPSIREDLYYRIQKHFIEESSTGKSIPIDALICKQSLEDAITTMKRPITQSVPKFVDKIKMAIRKRTEKGTKIIIAGIGNTIGIGV